MPVVKGAVVNQADTTTSPVYYRCGRYRCHHYYYRSYYRGYGYYRPYYRPYLGFGLF